MRVLEKNRQTMYYSVPTGETERYEKDENGNIKYITIDGASVPVSAGGLVTTYTKPKMFKANISSKLNKLHAVAYGVSQSSIYVEIMTPKGLIPMKYGMKIWLKNPIEYLVSEEDGEPDPDSSDYTVKGYMDEYQNYDWLLLQRNDV